MLWVAMQQPRETGAWRGSPGGIWAGPFWLERENVGKQATELSVIDYKFNSIAGHVEQFILNLSISDPSRTYRTTCPSILRAPIQVINGVPN